MKDIGYGGALLHLRGETALSGRLEGEVVQRFSLRDAPGVDEARERGAAAAAGACGSDAPTSIRGDELEHDQAESDVVRPWVGTGVLVASVLAVIAAGGLDRGTSAWLAFVAVAALAARSLLSLADARAALGTFAPSLDLIVELGLALGAAWLTGGVRSPLLVVPAAHLVLARRFHGAAAARFLAFATVAGLLVLASASPGIMDRPLATLARVLWPLAVLGGLELALPVRGGAPRRLPV